ncbi:MAG: efflux RND transporter periplasmic adaptor subunit [Candidatus Endonucleobacter sp. (ex Gigantidas childressi)]|nr:efflux RND transporter periplasmic adaptor subunit [Candidatus Endonucleobacter sp. (ex Gigantidas childressi)]
MSERQQPQNRWKHNIGMVIATLLGVALIIIAPKMMSPPERVLIKEHPIKVNSIIVPSLDVVPHANGFGRVSPGRTWESVAEVSGQVVWIADALRDGKVVSAGTELLRIEDANYRLFLAQKEAQLQASDVKKKTARDSLSIAKDNWTLLQTEYKRQKPLAAKGTVSKTVLDNSERQLLAGQTQVESLQNSLDLISAEHKVLIAQQDAAKLDLQRTIKIAPFDARITKVNIGIAQYANKGQLMFTADGLEVAEIEAQFSVGALQPLIRGVVTGKETNVHAGVTLLNSVVILHTTTHTIEWPARVDRISGNIDPLTQTIGVIVVVDHPYATASPGVRPPLLRDTFVEVELRSDPIKQKIVVPLSAIHDGRVYVADNDSRLEMRKVSVEFAQQGYAVIAEGLKPNERIITSDLITATEGMLLAPQEDKKSKQRMVIEATGWESNK